MKTKRNVFIDIIKGVAIFLMLWGHCIQYCVANSEVDFFENGVFKFIYSFHMPLFMLVCGYLFFYSFAKRNLKDLLIHRTQSLLQPIVFCSFFNYLVTTALFQAISGGFVAIFDGYWLSSINSLWFLWSTLASSIVVAIVCKKIENIFLQILLLFLFFPIVAIFPNMTLNLYMYPYFVLGFYFAKYKDQLPKTILRMRYICLFLFPVLLAFYEKKHYIYTSGILPNVNYSSSQILLIDAYRWLIGLVGSIFTVTLLQIAYKYIILKFNKPLIGTAIAKMGKYSLQLYTFSVPFLSIYLSVFFPRVLLYFNIDNIFVSNFFVYSFIFTFLLAIAYAFILFYIVKMLEKLKITKIMFGR